MGFLLVLAALIAVTVPPVMIGARLVQADRRSFGWALLGALLFAALSAVVGNLLDGKGLAIIVSVLGGALVLAVVLRTGFLKALLIAVAIVAVQSAALLLLTASMSGGIDVAV